MAEIATTGRLNWSSARQEVFEKYLVVFDDVYGRGVGLDFAVFQIAGEEWGPPARRLYVGPDDEMTSDLAQAEVFLHGHIKWDGCSNWDFDAQESCMLHFCGVKQASGIGRLMERMYDIAASEIAKFDRDLAGMPPVIDVVSPTSPTAAGS